MAERTLQPYDISGPFVDRILRNLFLYGAELDMGSLASSATITTQKTPVNDADVDVYGRVLVSNAGNISSMVLQAPRYQSQLLTVINYGAGTVTFDVVATSHVLNGSTGAIQVNTGAIFFSVLTANINSGALTWVCLRGLA